MESYAVCGGFYRSSAVTLTRSQRIIWFHSAEVEVNGANGSLLFCKISSVEGADKGELKRHAISFPNCTGHLRTSKLGSLGRKC